MPRDRRFVAPLLVAWLGIAGLDRAGAAEEFAFFHENVMGTSLELRLRADSADAARSAEDRALRTIDRLAAIFSNHDPSSAFRRWQGSRGGPVTVAPELWTVLQRADSWRSRSGGAFDPRVHVLTELWSACAREGRLPGALEIARAKGRMARPAWRLDPDSRAAERLSDGPLSLDGIAKGYIVERACEAALEPGRGVLGVLLNVGGDLRAAGAIAQTIGIADPADDSGTAGPLACIEVKDRAVATSGNAHRGFRIGDHWYSHIIDPRSGWPAARVVGATVIAEDSADADALATALNVLAPAEGVRLVEETSGADCLIVEADGTITRSRGWSRYERPRPNLVALADEPRPKETPAAGKPWGDEFELVVDFEIARPEAAAGRYRRPYVAVWVEDKDGFPVRTITLWLSQTGAGFDQWISNMKRWYRSDQVRRMIEKADLAHAISEPTRMPGRYKEVWDGKDNHGKPVARGTYTLHIEAAREHGTYQSIRKQITIADRPFAEELKGNVEIRSAALAYRRKGPGK